jgi:HK97 family phage portal protein
MLGGQETAAGARVNEEGALSWTAFSAGVRFLSETMASLPLEVFGRVAGGKELRPNHPLYPILHDSANEEMTSFEWRELTQTHLTLFGNAYTQIIRNGAGNVMELWPLNPDRVQPFRNARGLLRYRLTVPGKATGSSEGRILGMDDILHLRAFSQDGVLGRSLTKVHREAIGLGLATEEFGARFFGQGASPSGVYEHPGTLSQVAHDRLKESLSKEHSGLSQAHRLLLLEEGMKWQQISVDPEKAQFLGVRKFQVTECARILRLPPHILADLERATFSNVESMGIELVTHSVRPWAVRWEQRLRHTLLDPSESKQTVIEFNLEGLLRGDSAARAAFYNTMFQLGSLSPNEIRRRENLNPYAGGDRRYIQLNMIDVTTPEPDQMRMIVADRALEARGAPPEKRRRPYSRRRLRNSFVPIFTAAAERLTKAEVKAVRQALEMPDAGGDGQVFASPKSDLLEALEKFYEEQYPAIIETNMLPVQMSYATSMAEAVADEVDSEYDDAEVQKFVADYHETFTTRRQASSLGQLTAIVNESDPEETLELLEGRLDEWTEKNPEKIGRWDASKLGGAVALTVMASAGITRYRWEAFGSGCPICSEMDGRVIGISETFISKGETIEGDEETEPFTPKTDINHEPLHNGCDCMTVAD